REGQRARDVEHAGAAVRVSMSNGQAGDGDGKPAVDVEYPVLVVATHLKQGCARSLDVDAVLDRYLVAGQRDRLTVEARCEDDHVAVFGAVDRGPQRSGSLVVRVRDRKGGRHSDGSGSQQGNQRDCALNGPKVSIGRQADAKLP